MIERHATGKVLAHSEADLTVDDIPPRNAEIVDFPDKVAKGTGRLAVKATVDVPESGIKEVAFIVGPKADFDKPDAALKPVQGKPNVTDPSIWDGVLTLPKDATGKVVVTARFTSGVGLKSLASAEAEVDEPAPSLEDAAAAKPAPEKPGGIEGKVTENDVAQPRLEVYLIDPKAKDNENPVKKQVTTKPDGTYSFTELKPGQYRIYCINVATNRRDTKDVTVASGMTKTRGSQSAEPP